MTFSSMDEDRAGLLGIVYILTGIVILRHQDGHGLSRGIVGWTFLPRLERPERLAH